MKFSLSRPESAAEALQLLEQSPGKAMLLAGGTDVMVGMRHGKFQPDHLIDLGRVGELAGIRPSTQLEDGLFIGALTRISDVEHAAQLQGGWSILAQAAGTLASVQIRNLATLGGNICNAAPSADSFHLPSQPDKTAGVYIKHGARKAMDCCTLGVAALLTMKEGHVEKARIAIGAVAPTPLRVQAAEGLLEQGAVLTDDLIREAAQLAESAARPIDDVRGQAWYRKQMVAVDTRRALQQIAVALKGGQAG